MLEELTEKIQEQEELIMNLGEEYKKEVREREMRQAGESGKALIEKLKEQPGETMSMSFVSQTISCSTEMNKVS